MKRDLTKFSVDTRFGPAMQALTDNQRAFIVQYLDQGGRKQTEAYLIAYPECGGEKQAKAHASRFLHSDHGLAALREEADRRLRGGAVLGASVLMEIAEDVLHKDRFKAAQELLNRAGLIVATKHEVVVEDKRTDDEILKRIALIANKHGLDPRKLLGQDQVVDAEYEEVNMEGLEDL